MTMDLDTEWETFLLNDDGKGDDCKGDDCKTTDDKIVLPECPKSGDLTISTKVKVMFLNINSIDICNVFWDLDVIKFWEQKEGIIKKQIKYTCVSKKEYDTLLQRNKNDPSMTLITLKHVIKEITNHVKPEEEQQCLFKNISKITVGMSKKDILNYRTKVKGAFYNCFMLVLRIRDEHKVYNEVNIKIFNTGKMSFPGMITPYLLEKSIFLITTMLTKIMKQPVFYIPESVETVLINSNFTCKYYLDRNKLFNILKYNYKLHVNYDPCSYPGIQCKYFDNILNKYNNGQCVCTVPCCRKGDGSKDGNCREVSFMIFRTGSVLIVGKCSDELLFIIYDFLKKILYDNYEKIFIELNTATKKKKCKKRKNKYIYVDIK
jgi:hypothetical protein